MSTATVVTAAAEYRIAARIERLPVSRWHAKIGLVICTGFFFDAFDALAIAYVLPVLIPLWKLTPGEIGLLIASGYAGQIVGAICFGILAEKIGRVPCAIYALVIFTVMSLACAFAWSFGAMLAMRMIQGVGLGGEVPVLATYVNEIAPSTRRGRFALGFQFAFSIGLPIGALVGAWVVPAFGWQWMFVIGAVPGLLTVVFARILPESPRWLASKGRAAEADRVLTQIEAEVSRGGARPLPPVPENAPIVRVAQTRFGDLFKGIYLKRTLTVWILWFTAYIIVFGFIPWLPTLWRTVYHLPVQQALNYGLITTAAGLVGSICAVLFIDVLGRKRMFAIGLFVAAAPLLILAVQPDISATGALVLLSFTLASIAILALGLATYTAELYPTELRAFGGGVGNAWLRVASMVSPAYIGWILPIAGLNAVFITYGVGAVIGGTVCLLFAIETSGKALETLSPSLERP
jgi:putative MFS transporter